MAKPHIHALPSARKFGGTMDDYIEIHELMDSTKSSGAFADNRHRALTHNGRFIGTILPRVFGDTITNSDGKQVSVREISEQHVLEDFGGRFIPTPQDWLAGIEWEEWMNNGAGGNPPSHRKLANRSKRWGMID